MAGSEKDRVFRDGRLDILRWRKKRSSQAPDLPEGDDGRTIVNMNVEGMPWYVPERPEGAPKGGPEAGRRLEMTREETRFFTWGALKAALLVVGVMSLGIVLFVLFCQFVWFR